MGLLFGFTTLIMVRTSNPHRKEDEVRKMKIYKPKKRERKLYS
jgi:hypothetical protein